MSIMNTSIVVREYFFFFKLYISVSNLKHNIDFSSSLSAFNDAFAFFLNGENIQRHLKAVRYTFCNTCTYVFMMDML